MKFSSHMASFSVRDWGVTVRRSWLGNQMDGYSYAYTFTARKAIKDEEGFTVVAEIKGLGQKRKAIKAINKFEQSTQEA